MENASGTGFADIVLSAKETASCKPVSPSDILPSFWSEPVTVAPEILASAVIQQMERIHSSCVVVVQEQKPVGIFTERDLVKLIAQKQSIAGLPISALMTPQVITIDRQDIGDPWAVFQRMQQHHIRHLPIVDEAGCLIGIMTTQSLRETLKPTDLLKLRRVSEVMTSQVVHTSPEGTLFDLIQVMAQQKVSCVVITEKNQAGDEIPVGILTERDIVRLQNQGLDPEATIVQDVMTAPLILIHVQDTLMQVYELMSQYQIRRMVVAGDRGELVGLVTQTNILYAIDPLEAYALIQVLQQQVNQLQERNLTLLQQSNRELERQVQERIAQQDEKDCFDRLLASTALYIRQSSDLKEILVATVTELRRILQCDRVLVYQFLPDWRGCVVSESVVNGSLPLAERCIIDPCIEQLRNSVSQGKAQVLHDIPATPDLSESYGQLLTEFQVRASLVVPIFQDDRLWGLLVCHQCSAARRWRESEIDFLTQLAIHVSIAIQQATLVDRLTTELLERQQAELALQQFNTELEQRVAERTLALTETNARLETELVERHKLEKMKVEFISIVSHELRTPLTSMQAALSLLQKRIVDPASHEGEQMIQIAAKGVERLVRLVNEILDLERLGSGKIRLEKCLCNTAALVNSAIDQMQALASQNGITLIAQPQNLEITVDSDRILQVLVNLISNAIKFSFPGATVWVGMEIEGMGSGEWGVGSRETERGSGGAGERGSNQSEKPPIHSSTHPLIDPSTHRPIHSSTHRPIDPSTHPLIHSPTLHIRFSIKDQGRGIPAEQIDSIFERFQQVDTSDSREKSGIGLGLTICRHIVQGHGGQIWAESTLGEGSVFYFTVPLAQP